LNSSKPFSDVRSFYGDDLVNPTNVLGFFSYLIINAALRHWSFWNSEAGPKDLDLCHQTPLVCRVWAQDQWRLQQAHMTWGHLQSFDAYTVFSKPVQVVLWI